MSTTIVTHTERTDQPRIITDPHTCPVCGKPAFRVTLYDTWLSPNAIPKPLDDLGSHIVYIECRNYACPGPACWRCVRLQDDGPITGPVFGHVEIDHTDWSTEVDSIHAALAHLEGELQERSIGVPQ
ncbi:MAG: hypothetical protein KGY78_09960 [Anaerolineae bacterium]|nr:hypothetical protein [Anaerolineae bacterium]